MHVGDYKTCVLTNIGNKILQLPAITKRNLGTQNPTGKNTITIQNEKPSNFLTYKNDTYGFRVDYPTNWTKEDGQILHIKSTRPNTEKVEFISP